MTDLGHFFKNPFFRMGMGFSMMLSILSISFAKGPMHLFINQFHSVPADFIFKYITHLGDGFIFLVLGIILFFAKGKFPFFHMLAAAVLTLFIVGFLKKVVFPDFHRPLMYLGEEAGLYLVEGVKMNMRFSFPSGHTTAAFAAWGVLAYHFPKKALFIIILTSFIAFSRVYLSQHFIMDLAFGSFLGLCIAIFSISGINKIQEMLAKNKLT